MRILYHHRTRAEDAQGIHIQEMTRAFRDLGHELHMVALVHNGGEGRGDHAGSFWERRTISTPNWLYDLMTMAYNFYGYNRLCRTIRLFKPDFLYERYSLNTFCGIWASRRFGIPLILEVNAPLYHEQHQLGNLTFKRFARFSERWVCSNSTFTIVVSNVIRRLLISQGVPDRKIVVMPNGIDPKKFRPEISGEGVRRRYRLNGKLIVGFVGWFREWHAVETLLQLMYEEDLANRQIALLLVGDGPAFPKLWNYAKEHSLLPHVIFTGALPPEQIPQHIAAMDLAVQPKAPEYACPLKIIEYMAMAKCIVAPNQPNISELLKHGLTAFLFEQNDKASLHSTVLQLLANPVIRHITGRRAHQTVFDRGFLWRTNAERVLSLLSNERLLPIK